MASRVYSQAFTTLTSKGTTWIDSNTDILYMSCSRRGFTEPVLIENLLGPDVARIQKLAVGDGFEGIGSDNLPAFVRLFDNLESFMVVNDQEQCKMRENFGFIDSGDVDFDVEGTLDHYGRPYYFGDELLWNGPSRMGGRRRGSIGMARLSVYRRGPTIGEVRRAWEEELERSQRLPGPTKSLPDIGEKVVVPKEKLVELHHFMKLYEEECKSFATNMKLVRGEITVNTRVDRKMLSFQ